MENNSKIERSNRVKLLVNEGENERKERKWRKRVNLSKRSGVLERKSVQLECKKCGIRVNWSKRSGVLESK